MRLASAFMSGILLAASGAWAAPAPSGQDLAASQAQAMAPVSGAAAPESHWREDVGEGRAAGKSPPRLTRATAPAFSTGGGGEHDRMTEAMCYTVFGELRCDRVPAKVR